MNISFSVVLLQGIPEQIAVVILALSIARQPFKWREVIFVGIILAITAFMVRLLPITFGVHTVVLIGLLFAYLSFIKKVDLSSAILSSLLSFLVLIVSESLIVPTIMNLFAISREELLTNDFIRILITLPHVLIIFFVALFIKKKRLDIKESSDAF
ncbi:MAG: hypothetical protein JM58_03330 [Peptococcaceae bacterium BICA1-8]|nr:MAG: hypothetical protein JM58_03330 [Peptococcaceae bacterium BICA1-8]